MNTLIDENSPSRCRLVGLDCETCTARSAREVAACCGPLHGAGITKLFFSVYPSLACAPMKDFFSDAYLAATSAKTAVAVA